MNHKIKMHKLLFFIGIIIVASCSACGYILGGKNYKITCDYIKGVQTIDQFTIAELEVISMNSRSTMPGNYVDIQQVVCQISKGTKEKKRIFFHKENKNYKWVTGTVDSKILENDSIANLSFDETLAYLRSLGITTLRKEYSVLPISFKPSTWYHIFGLDNTEGSYFMYFDEDKKCTVKYFSGGPF